MLNNLNQCIMKKQEVMYQGKWYTKKQWNRFVKKTGLIVECAIDYAECSTLETAP